VKEEEENEFDFRLLKLRRRVADVAFFLSFFDYFPFFCLSFNVFFFSSFLILFQDISLFSNLDFFALLTVSFLTIFLHPS